MLLLTARGRATMRRVEPVWQAVRRCTEDLLTESGYDGLTALAAVEDALARMDMYSRLRTCLRPASDKIDIIRYRPAYKHDFRTLNLEWLGHDVPIEHHDRRVLAHPDTHIILKGGQIFFARVKGEIVGTAAVVPHDSTAFEITKMAVTESWRGAGIGRRLAMSAIEWACSTGAVEIRIATSPKLTTALALYRSLGFVETHPNAAWRAEYRRRTIFFKLPKNIIEANKEEKTES